MSLPQRQPVTLEVWLKTGVIKCPHFSHHPTIRFHDRYMVYNGYYKVMSNIPKMGHLPTPGRLIEKSISAQVGFV